MLKNKKIVLIMTDTQRTDMVSCYGSDIATPSIDRIAENGIRFEKAYTTQPVCQPARAGIFTGQYPHSCGSWSNSMGISDNTHSVGERLENIGVHTAYIGKWHLDGGDYFGLGRAPKGWDPDYWYDMRNYIDELGNDADRLRSRLSVSMDDEEGISEEFTYAHRCSNKAKEFLEKHGSEDFLLVVSYDEPHAPYLCPKKYSEMYRDFKFPMKENLLDTLEGKPDYQKAWAGSSRFADRENINIDFLRWYLGCNSFVDYEIGRVLDSIEEFAPDATVIYTSDHGDMLESHCLNGKGPAAYEEITHIPMVIGYGNIEKGRVDTNPVSHINITPTILEMMGCEIPPVIDGKSLVPELEDGSVRVNDEIFIEFGRYEVDHDGFGGFQPLRAAFDGRYKLSVNLLDSDELYDLEEDPCEMNNLINDQKYSDIRDKLHNAILENMNNTRDPFRGYYWERRPWRKDASDATWRYTGMTRQRGESTVFEKGQLDYENGLPIKELVRAKNQ